MAKILIVDDSAFARSTIRLIVEHGGHEVVGAAADGPQALDLFMELQPDIVTLDYLMEGMKGDEVLKNIIRMDPDARVVMVSGSSDASLEETTLNDGAKSFVDKPNLPRDLLRAIDSVIAS